MRSIARTVKVATGATGGETSQTTTEIYDRYGRLTEVQEPSGAAGAVVTTSYAYDVADRLTGVSTPIGNGQRQERAFAYDGRGFLLSEKHPELGVAGEGTRRYEGYDAMGNAHRQYVGAQNGLFDLAFTYDLTGRLTAIRERGGLRRPVKEFVYGAEQSNHNRSKGKVLQAIRHNYHVPPWNPQAGEVDVSVTETYTYGGQAGRVSRRTTAASGSQSFTQSWTWNDLGLPTLVGYPQCTFQPCAGSSTSRTVGHTFTRGRLTAVPGYATAISYHDNGMLAEIEYPNQVAYFQDRDPHGMRRPGSIGLTLQGAIVEPELYLAAGAVTHNLLYQYDGAGNIKTLGPEKYQYDGVSRVVRGTLGTGAYQHYTFDRFGNLGTILTDENLGPATRTYAIDPKTNRLASEAYDADGNQLTYGAGGLGFVYTWDPLSKMKASRRNNGSQDEFYVYTADDERLYTFNAAVSPAEETWTLRDLDGKVLRTWTNVGASAGTWSHEKDHAYRDGQLLASWSPTDGPRYYHLDHLGTPRLITNQHGRRADGAAYYPFGEQVGWEQPSDERMRFTGHERDQHGPGQLDDLDYMHARYCNPMTGRFLSVDPSQKSARQKMPQTWNRYTYVANNPIKFLDPDGRDLTIAFDFKGSDIGLKMQARIAVETMRAFRRAGVQDVKIRFQATSHRFKGKSLRAPVKFQSEVIHQGRQVLGHTATMAGRKSRVSVGMAPTSPEARLFFLVNVAAHEVGHQAGLHIFRDHFDAKPGTLMQRPPSPEALSSGFLSFSEADAEMLSDLLNEEEEILGQDSHGSATGNAVDCARGTVGGGRGANYCG
ncbi:MAG: RHS repeat-associated core domain-containing protein [Acidobacteriota bacterium]